MNRIGLPSVAGFTFFDPGVLRDNELILRLKDALMDVSGVEPIPTYRFQMVNDVSAETMGGLNLRIGTDENLVRNRGHIGFTVDGAYRGHGYAGRGCLLVLQLARNHGLGSLWITCDPDNMPSRRTCERIGARLVEVVSVPEGTEAYAAGARRKCRYELVL